MFIHIEAISSFFPVKSVEPLHFWYGFESGEQCHVATPFLEGHLSVYAYRSDLVIFFPVNQLLKNCCGSVTFWYGFESGVQCLIF